MILTGASPYGHQSDVAYKCRYDHNLPSYHQCKMQKIACHLCAMPMCEQSLTSHLLNIHSVSSPAPPWCVDLTSTTGTFYVSFPLEAKHIPCPVAGCPAVLSNWYGMYSHFAYWHPSAIICINEEGPHPQCPSCGWFLHSVNDAHLASCTCHQLAAWWQECAQVLQHVEAKSVTFMVGSQTLETVSEFKYLGQILQEHDQDDFAVSANLHKAHACWGQVFQVLSTEHATTRVMAWFYLAVLQSVLLYGCKSWVLSQWALAYLNSFHHRCAHAMAHQHIWWLPTGEWIVPHSAEVLDCCGLSPISTYIAQCKTYLLHWYAELSSSLYEQCQSSVPLASASHHHSVWWD